MSGWAILITSVGLQVWELVFVVAVDAVPELPFQPQAMGAAADVANEGAGVADDKTVVGDVVQDDSTGTHHGPAADGDAREDDGTGTDGRAVADQGALWRPISR